LEKKFLKEQKDWLEARAIFEKKRHEANVAKLSNYEIRYFVRNFRKYKSEAPFYTGKILAKRF
jgi:hypothetical protein